MDSQQSDSYILCANGCGFFGTAVNQNLCSKCFREKTLNSNSLVEGSSLVTTKQEEEEEVVSVPTSSSKTVSDSVENSKKKKNRCLSCSKRVGLTGFQCRCGSTFCSTHRYPENHECSFDFKAVGRDAIAKANPLVKADKLQKF